MIGESTDAKVSYNVYNGFNQLIKANMGSSRAEYTYNASGLRTSKTVNGTETRQIWSGANIIFETNGSDEVQYLRGINLISINDGITESYYMFNAHGDVVHLTGSTGAVTKNYSYDAFGVEENQDSNDTNPFRYCGEYFDKETQTYYLRARYYNPVTGRFISEDICLGSDNEPLSLNLYTYCTNNPIVYSDPSGMIGVLPDGTIYMDDGDTEIDRKLLELKLEYAKEGSDKDAIANEAKLLRDQNPDQYHVLASISLDYYIIYDYAEKINETMLEAEEKYGKNSPWGALYRPSLFNPKGDIGLQYILFYMLVKTGGEYDVKYKPDWQHEHFIYNGDVIDKDETGNIIYGYLGKSMGFRDSVLVAAAGLNQIYRNISDSRPVSFNLYSFGDDPRDTKRIYQGIGIYNEWH